MRWVGVREEKKKRKKKGLLSEVGLINTVTPTLLKTWIQVDMYIDDQVICCWFVFARVFLASLLCDITTRAHVWAHWSTHSVFCFVYSSPTNYSQALISHVRPLPYWIRNTQTSKRKFIFALVIAVLPNLDEHQLHYLLQVPTQAPPPLSLPSLATPLTPTLKTNKMCSKSPPPKFPPCSPPPYYLPYTWIQKEPRKGHQFCTWEAFKYVARSWSAQPPSYLGRLKFAK